MRDIIDMFWIHSLERNMNKKLLASLILAGLVTITAGCDDSSKKVDEGIDKAKETATQVNETAQDKAKELTDQAKEKPLI